MKSDTPRRISKVKLSYKFEKMQNYERKERERESFLFECFRVELAYTK